MQFGHVHDYNNHDFATCKCITLLVLHELYLHVIPTLDVLELLACSTLLDMQRHYRGGCVYCMYTLYVHNYNYTVFIMCCCLIVFRGQDGDSGVCPVSRPVHQRLPGRLHEAGRPVGTGHCRERVHPFRGAEKGKEY